MTSTSYFSLFSALHTHTSTHTSTHTHLVQSLAVYLDPIDLQDLIIHRQQPSALSQSTRHQARDEYTWHPLQAHGSDPNAGAIPYVEAKWFVRPVFEQTDAPADFWHNVDVNDRCDL